MRWLRFALIIMVALWSLQAAEQRSMILTTEAAAPWLDWSEPAPRGGLLGILSRTDLAVVQAAGIPVRILHEDLDRSLARERGQHDGERMQALAQSDFFDACQPLDSILAHLRGLAEAYPERLQEEVIGSSLEERDIIAFHLPARVRPEAPILLVQATQHAREWLTPMAACWIIQQLLENPDEDPRLETISDQVHVVVVPVVNPDGYVYSWQEGNRAWRKNRRDNGDGNFGVDLNRNWDYAWQYETGTQGQTYPGPSAFSEPESRVMRDFILELDRIHALIDMHTYGKWGGEIIQPFAHTDEPAPRLDELTAVSEAMALAMTEVVDDHYDPFTVYTSNYGGNGVCIDWCLGERDILAWAWELRAYGFIVDPEDLIPGCQEAMAGVIEAALRLQTSHRIITIAAQRGGTALRTDVHVNHVQQASSDAEIHVLQYLVPDRDQSLVMAPAGGAGVADGPRARVLQALAAF